MFWHNFKYTFQVVFRDRALVFWTFAFPIILGTFFYLAFSNITSSESLDVIDVAVVDNAAWQENSIFRETFQALSDDTSADQLFHARYVSASEAAQLLQDGEISGYLLLENSKEPSDGTPVPSEAANPAAPSTPIIFTAESDVDSTIFKLAVEGIAEQADIFSTVAQKDPSKLTDLAHATAARIVDESSSNLDYTMVEYYTLIAMTCLYGGIIGMVAVNQLLANMSTSGKRISVSPASKSTLVLSSLLASYLIQLLGLALLFAYLIFVLHIDFGANLPLIILLTFVGCLAGLALGVFLASAIRGTANMKVGLILAVTMFGCFLAGMMGVTMKYLVDTNLPLLNRLNPANLITDGFYSLYYYDTLDRYWGNIITLVIITLVMIGISVYSLRKEQYDRL